MLSAFSKNLDAIRCSGLLIKLKPAQSRPPIFRKCDLVRWLLKIAKTDVNAFEKAWKKLSKKISLSITPWFPVVSEMFWVLKNLLRILLICISVVTMFLSFLRLSRTGIRRKHYCVRHMCSKFQHLNTVLSITYTDWSKTSLLEPARHAAIHPHQCLPSHKNHPYAYTYMIILWKPDTIQLHTYIHTHAYTLHIYIYIYRVRAIYCVNMSV